jgi:hypothetical protein
MSPLRCRMIEDMTIRNLSPATRQSYLGVVTKFSSRVRGGRSADRLGIEEVRAYQLHLASQGVAWASLNQTVCALRFFYGVTLGGCGRRDAGDDPLCPRPAPAPGGAQRRGNGLLPRSIRLICGRGPAPPNLPSRHATPYKPLDSGFACASLRRPGMTNLKFGAYDRIDGIVVLGGRGLGSDRHANGSISTLRRERGQPDTRIVADVADWPVRAGRQRR